MQGGYCYPTRRTEKVYPLQRAIYDSDGKQVDCDVLGIYYDDGLATLEMAR